MTVIINQRTTTTKMMMILQLHPIQTIMITTKGKYHHYSISRGETPTNHDRTTIRKRNTAQPQRQGKEKLRKLTERWTSEETEALKKGYQECGFGQWGMIKMKYSQQLQNRTIQQLKDKARNIAKAFERSGQPLGKWEAALR